MENINTQKYWDSIWRKEGQNTWRKYPHGFNLIKQTFVKPSKILDMGCGMGVLMRHLKDHDITGADISKVAVQRLRRAGWKAFVHDAAKDIWGNFQGYDAVVMTEFLEHFHDDQIDFILMNASNTAPILIGIVPDQMLAPEEHAEHYQCFDSESLKKLLSKYYSDIEIHPFVESFPKGDGTGIRLNCLYFLAQNR